MAAGNESLPNSQENASLPAVREQIAWSIASLAKDGDCRASAVGAPIWLVYRMWFWWSWTASLVTALSMLVGPGRACSEEPEIPSLHVRVTDDFQLGSAGSAAAWQQVPWTELNKRTPAEHDYSARMKMLYSQTGLYLLMEGTDARLTASLKQDFENLWTEDVFEAFFWTDERYPVYFEYEISPLEKELPILIPNFGGDFLGWRPWHYEGDRVTKKRVTILGGRQESGAAIKGWRAEVYFPYDLLKPLQNVPPQAGSRWRANFYRVDYDDGKRTGWDWARVGPSFHEYQKFGVLIFQ